MRCGTVLGCSHGSVPSSHSTGVRGAKSTVEGNAGHMCTVCVRRVGMSHKITIPTSLLLGVWWCLFTFL